MKRTLSLLVALALLLACSGAPLSAAAAPLDGADLPPVFSQNNVAPEYPEAAPAAAPFRKMPCMPQSWTRC